MSEKRKLAFKGYQINDEIMAAAKSDAMVQHCLPAHRGEEITAEVFEAHAQEIFDEAENRLHAQKAVMYLLMKEAEGPPPLAARIDEAADPRRNARGPFLRLWTAAVLRQNFFNNVIHCKDCLRQFIHFHIFIPIIS